jgi:hypothetical protein
MRRREFIAGGSVERWRGRWRRSRLQMLHELVPTAAVIALLINPANPESIETETKELQGQRTGHEHRARGLRPPPRPSPFQAFQGRGKT